MTALTVNNIVVVPIRSGVGLRLGANVGLFEVHPDGDLEPVLTSRTSPHWRFLPRFATNACRLSRDLG